MNKKELLDNILGMLYTIKEDEQKLEQLYNYIYNEIYEEPEDEEIKVPEGYKPVVEKVAEYLNANMICYINPKTLEVVYIPSDYIPIEEDSVLYDEEEDPFKQYLERIDNEWEKVIRVEPPESYEAFRFMEAFVDSGIVEGKFKYALEDALSNKNPFRNFNAIIHQSPVREEWFSFKQKCLEDYVALQLQAELSEF